MQNSKHSIDDTYPKICIRIPKRIKTRLWKIAEERLTTASEIMRSCILSSPIYYITPESNKKVRTEKELNRIIKKMKECWQ